MTKSNLPQELESIAHQVLEAAAGSGATAADVDLSDSIGLTVTVRGQDVESLEFQNDRDLGVTVYFDHNSGNASTSDLSVDGIRAAVESAVAIARATESDPYSGLPDAERLATEFPDLALDHPWDITPEAAIERALACEKAALESDARIKQSEGASVETGRGFSLLANSLGFVGHRVGTQHSASCAVIAEDGGGMQRDYDYTVHRDAAQLTDLEALGRRAAERALARLGSRKPPTGTYPVLFRHDVARGLIGHFLSAISGGALYRRSSFLLDSVGTPVFHPSVRMQQRPLLPGAMASAAFDREGVATSERTLVDGGVLQGYLLSSYSARRLGLETTGNAGGVFNLEIDPTAGTLDEQIADMGTGLLVTELMGQGVNPVTGDYSRGAAGFWVENGAIAYPVAEATIAGALPTMFRSIGGIGGDVDVRGSVRCGSILLDAMTIA